MILILRKEYLMSAELTILIWYWKIILIWAGGFC